VSTFGELFEQAEQEIRTHIESATAEFTNYFVVQGAVLVASIRSGEPGSEHHGDSAFAVGRCPHFDSSVMARHEMSIGQ
jgi:hypothetical protein